MEAIAALVEDGALRVHVAKTFPLNGSRARPRARRERQHRGRQARADDCLNAAL
jgi:NADPH:quinone reductase-like Zn-dependent oxidoreductase